MKKLSVVLLIGALFLSLGIQPSAAQAPQKLKIGHVGSFSGPLAPMLTATRNGVLLAQDHINADGGFTVAGQKYLLDVVTCDDRTDPKTAVACVTRLMNEDDAKVIIGPMISSGIMAIQPITQPKKVLLVNFGSAKQIIRPGITHTFNGSLSDDFRAKFMVPFYVEQMGIKKLAFVVENSTAQKAMYDNFAPAFEAAGCKIVAKENYEPGETDFHTILTKIKSKNPDALFLCTLGGTAALVVKQRLDIGWPVQTIGQGNPVASMEFFRITGPAVEGHIDMGNLNPWMKLTPEVNEVVGINMKMRERYDRDYIKKYGEQARIGGVDDAGYDYVYLVVEMMKRAGTITDTDKMIQAAKDPSFAIPLTGQKYRISPHGRFSNWGYVNLYHPSQRPDNLDTLAVYWTTDVDNLKYDIKFLKKPPRIEDIRKQRGY